MEEVLRMYKQNKVINTAYAAPSRTHSPKLVKLNTQFSWPMK